MEEAGRVDGRGEKGWMEYGDWNNVKSLRFAWNAAGRSLSANMEFLTQKTESVGYQNITLLAVAGCLQPRAERAFPQCRKGFSGRLKRLYGDMRRAVP